MTIWGAFTNSVQALQAQSNALAVISQNVANVNTTGYKKQVDNFQTLLSEFIYGTNIFGVQVAQQHNNDVQGNFQSTGIWDNLSINGPGFFVVNSAVDGSGTTSFTRAGNFGEAVVGTSGAQSAYLTDGRGDYLMGVAANGATSLDTALGSSTAGLTAVNYQLGSTLPGKATSQIFLQGSLPANASTAVSAAAAGQKLTTNLTTTNTTSTPGFDPTTTEVYQTGTLSIQLGTLSGGTFTSSGAAATVNITDGTLQGIANAINGSGTGVTAAIILNGAGNAQLQLSGPATGATNGFQVTGTNTGGTGLSLAGLNYTAANAAQNATDFTANSQAADATIGNPTQTSGVPVFDNSFNTQTMSLNFTKVGSDSWDVTYSLDPNVGTVTAPTSAVPTTLTFDGAGNFVSQGGPSSVSVNWADGTTSSISVDLSKMSQLASGSLILNAQSQNGYSSATMVKAEFDSQGNLYGDYSNGQKQLLFQVPVATFTAPNALQSKTGTLFTQTGAAGTLNIDAAQNLNDTAFTPGALETSNVSLEDEFSRMITTQAAYNSATKVFQVADSMTTNVRDLIT